MSFTKYILDSVKSIFTKTPSKYILESCDSGKRYRVIFTGETSLNVNEICFVDCDGIDSGCYRVKSDTKETLEEYNASDCLFVEYDDCNECIVNNIVIDSTLSAPQQNCYRWDRCDGGSGNIYTVTSYTPTDDTVLYYGVCYEISTDIVLAEPTDLTSIPSNQFFGKCSSCSPCDLGCSLEFGPVSPSPTPSVTPTVTQTPATSTSVTPTVTQTPATSTSVTPTVTQTPDATASVTPTVTQTPATSTSVTPTVTQTPDATASVTPTNSVTPTLTPSITTSPSVAPTNAYSFYDCCDDEYFTVLTGGTLDAQFNTNPVTIGTVQPWSVSNAPFVNERCYERVAYDPLYTQYNLNTGFWLWGNTSYTDCTDCVGTEPCFTNDVSLSGCCDGTVYNVSSMQNGPDIGESAVLTYQQVIGGQALVIGACYVRIPYNASYPDGPTVAAFTYLDTYSDCDDCVNNNTCPSVTPTPSITTTPSITVTPSVTQTPSNTTTPSITPTQTVTPSITPTTSAEPTYTSFLLTPCCENNFSGVTVLNHAQVLDSLSVTTGDIVSLDSICYTLDNVAPFTSSNTPSTQNTYLDCDTCLSSQSQTYWCVHTYVACFEENYSAGDLMAAPTRYNDLIAQVDPTGTGDEYLQFTHIVTNTASQNVSFEDCYVYDPTYDETATLKFHSSNGTSCCQPDTPGAKCSGAYVVLRSCDLYTGTTVGALTNNNLDALVYMTCDFVSGSSVGGGVVQLSDTIQAPELLGGAGGYLGGAQNQIIINDGFNGICYTIVGNTSSMQTYQNTTVGTSWQDNAEVLDTSTSSGCGGTDCNCLNDVTITNTSLSVQSITYLRCGLSGSGNLTTENIPAGGSSFLSGTNGCANINSMVLSRTNQGLLSSISFDFSSSIDCA